MIRRFFVAVLLVTAFVISSHAQRFVVKTNLPYWGIMSPNAGIEFRVGKRFTFDVNSGGNLLRPIDGKHFKHWFAQPEFRYWFCESFNGHFLGLHGLGGQYNIGGWDLPIGELKNLKDHRYQGYFYGGGLTYGHQWYLGNRWNLELSIGAGYLRMHYDKFRCANCGSKLDSGKKDYLGVTKAALSLIYVIK